MTLPMVTCPLCCRPGFSTSDSLCTALVDVTTRKLCCPICNHIVVGLDKFTIHLFSHSMNKGDLQNGKDLMEICHSENNNLSCLSNKTKNNNINFDLDPINNNNQCNNNFVKLQNSVNEGTNFKSPDKKDWRPNNANSNLQLQHQKPFNIPPDSSLIYFRADNGQVFAISPDSIGTSLLPKNVTINTQNYITNTNITTSTVQTNVIEKVQKRKYSQVFEKENVETGGGRACGSDVHGSPEHYSNVDSLVSSPSTPSVFSESDKVTSSVEREREFESCRDLLTKGDFSTIIDDTGELELSKEELATLEGAGDGEEVEMEGGKKEDEGRKEGLTCELCPYVFPNKTILAMHTQLIHKKVEMESESKRKQLVCSMCPRTFNLRSSLMIHRRVAHDGGFGNNDSKQPPKPSCHICGKFFKKEIHLSQHMKAHDEKQWQCTICSKTFTTKYFLKKHRRLHTGETPYRCATCSKAFTFQQSYHKHLMYHSDDKPYCCAQCGRLFKELSTLHNHERIHSGEKPFTCETCGKAFRQRVSYLVHRRIHTGVMPYKCTACNKSFRYKISQRTHKCTVQPPGVVVRATGYLVERLQAIMNKSNTEKQKSVENKFNDGEQDSSALKNTPSTSDSSSSSIQLPQSEDATQTLASFTGMPESVLIEGNTLIKGSEFEKISIDKPQIYLLVKGPNEETYYQPLLLSQQNLSQSTESVSVGNSKNVTASSANRVHSNDAKSLNSAPAYKKIKNSTHTKSKKKEKKHDVKTKHKNDTVTSSNKRLEHEISNKKQNSPDVEVIESNVREEVSMAKNEGSASEIVKSNSVENEKTREEIFTSEDAAMTDLLNHLTYEGLMEEPPSNGHSTGDRPKGDLVMMDSSEILSLILSPSLSSPSDRLGRLSLSPGGPTSTSTTHPLSMDCFEPSQVFTDHFDHHQDPLFDHITDDTLKELLFGIQK